MQFLVLILQYTVPQGKLKLVVLLYLLIGIIILNLEYPLVGTLVFVLLFIHYYMLLIEFIQKPGPMTPMGLKFANFVSGSALASWLLDIFQKPVGCITQGRGISSLSFHLPLAPVPNRLVGRPDKQAAISCFGTKPKI